MRWRCTSVIQTHQRVQKPAPAENLGTCQPARHRAARAVKQADIAQTADACDSAITSVLHSWESRDMVKTEGRGARGGHKSGNMGTRDGRKGNSGSQ